MSKTDWIVYLEADPKSEPYMSMAKEWRKDKRKLADAEAERDWQSSVASGLFDVLSEADTLLREARDALDSVAQMSGEARWDLAARIDAFRNEHGA